MRALDGVGSTPRSGAGTASWYRPDAHLTLPDRPAPESVDVDSWADALTVGVAAILRDVDDHDRIKEVSGRKRTYFIEEGQQSDLVKPRRIPDTNLYLETNFSANDCVRKIEQVMAKYGYDKAELEVFSEET